MKAATIEGNKKKRKRGSDSDRKWWRREKTAALPPKRGLSLAHKLPCLGRVSARVDGEQCRTGFGETADGWWGWWEGPGEAG